jgi:PAS domain S-box-containing protein
VFLAVIPPVFLWIALVSLLGIVIYLLNDRRRIKGLSQKTRDAVQVTSGSATTLSEEEVALLQEQLSSFHQAMAQCPSSIVIADLNGNIQYVNARFCEVTGYSSDDVVGRNPRLLKSGNMDPAVYSDLWKTISSGCVWRGELENRKKDGRLFWELVSISPIKDATGNLLRYFGVKEDITEAKAKGDEAKHARMEAEIADAADLAKSVFLNLISQEMKNPLNRILGFTNLVSQSQVTNDQLKHLNQIGRAGLDLLNLIDSVLDFTRAETGTLEFESSPFKLIEVLDNVLYRFEQLAAEKNLLIHREISESIPDYLIGDEKRFRDVISPLLDNAVKFTYEGSITFKFSANFNDTTKLWELKGEVSDTGPGIPSERLNSLFKPFTQMEPGLNTGPGLGLSLCQRLCLLQGGTLSGGELGKGTTFFFDLKLKPMEIDLSSVQLVPGAEGVQFAKSFPIEILIAEDNRINRRLLETLMERLGYQAAFALDGLGVMTQVKKQPYDLILMDLQMPNMSGLEAARRIRSGEAGDDVKDVRIVAISALTSNENLQASREIGMNAFLPKPFDISKIKLEIMHAYEGKMARRASLP